MGFLRSRSGDALTSGGSSRFNSRKLVINHHPPNNSSSASTASTGAHLRLPQVGLRGQSQGHRDSLGQSHCDMLLLPPQPPPPPSLKMAPLAAATLPRNFGQNQANPNQRARRGDAGGALQHQQHNTQGRQPVQSAVIRRSRQGTSSAAATVVASAGFMQLPSPPDPPSSFALSALSLDLPALSELPSPPLDCDIVLPPPAESLYSLPRRLPPQPQPSTKVTPIAVGSNSAGATASNSLSTEQLIAREDIKDSSVNYPPHQMLEQLKKMRSHKQNTESVV